MGLAPCSKQDAESITGFVTKYIRGQRFGMAAFSAREL